MLAIPAMGSTALLARKTTFDGAVPATTYWSAPVCKNITGALLR
jgi:hypothetical protein